MTRHEADARWNFNALSEAVRKRSRWMEVLGVLLILYGMFCLVFVGAASLATVLWIGGLLILAGMTQIAATVAFWFRGRGGFSLGLILGCLCAIAGILCLMFPATSLLVLTFVLAIYFISSGVVRLTIVASERFPGWGMSIVAALAEILLGIVILAGYPSVSLVALGTILGVQMIFSGSSALAMGIAVRRILSPHPEAAGPNRPATRLQH